MLYNNLSVNDDGHLTIAGFDTVLLAKKYGTPLYVIDEDRVRENCRVYFDAVQRYFGDGSFPLYASKAFCCKAIYPIIEKEGLGADLVSPGEIYTAMKAGFPLEKGFYHGNNKSAEEVSFAMESGVGYFVVDNPDELELVDKTAGEKGLKQKVLLRVTPGIDSHTFEAINTGRVDSKFGVSIPTGQAEEFCAEVLKKENLEFCGYHCHIGSQIFECEPFFKTADIMLKFAADMRDKYSLECKILDLGSGFGIKYRQSDDIIDYDEGIKGISVHVKARCAEYGLEMPKIILEPGRGIIGDAGLTLYTVGSVKEIRGYKSYVSIDGGMTDNPRYALYKAEHTVINASRANEAEEFCCTVAGHCCESGDVIREDVNIAKPRAGEILAALSTGAYNYSMASNYNRFPRPAAVMVSKKGERLIIRRETLEDIVSCDL